MIKDEHFFEINIQHDHFENDREVKALCIKAACSTIENGIKSSPWLKGMSCQFEASISLVEDLVIKELNKKYRDKDTATNVLSFALLENEDLENIQEEAELFSSLALGDIVISLDTVSREAKEVAVNFEDRLAHMVAHGMLHLLGYDHDDDNSAELMEKIEAKVLAELGLSNPYN